MKLVRYIVMNSPPTKYDDWQSQRYTSNHLENYKMLVTEKALFKISLPYIIRVKDYNHEFRWNTDDLTQGGLFQDCMEYGCLLVQRYKHFQCDVGTSWPARDNDWRYRAPLSEIKLRITPYPRIQITTMQEALISNDSFICWARKTRS